MSQPRKSIRVRAYAPSDHKAVVDLFITSIHEYPENKHELQPQWVQLIDMSVKGDLAEIEAAYFAAGGHYWVATVDEDGEEKLAGMVALQRKPENEHEGELRRLSVSSNFRRCGVAKLLVATLENWAREQGLTRITLGTGKTVTAARRFYESVGYACFKSFMITPEVEVTLYEKNLARDVAISP